MTGWAYALLCVLGPAAWGMLMYLLFGWVQERRRRPRPRNEEFPGADYSI